MSQAAVKIATAKPLLSVNNIEVVYDDVIQVLR
jgi:branched-chain amino acid transport system ATP-binding protein